MTQRRAAKVYRGTPRNLAFLARELQAGELVAVPTETVYGLAANALDAEACARIFRAKGRPSHDPLIVHIHSLDQLEQVCTPNAEALRLAKAFWPGPLTLVLPKKRAVPDIVTAGRNSVAVRMPSHRLFRRLLKLAGVPLAAPSANRFGYISPTTAAHVQDGLGTKIRHILDGGAAHIGLESTIVDLRAPEKPAILRPGAVTARELERVLGRHVAVPMRKRAADSANAKAQLAPGLLARHYSPRTRLVLHGKIERLPHAGPDEAFILLRKPTGSLPPNVFWFDARGELRGVARRLFALLRELDRKNFAVIHAELAPERGLGHAINDRLRRAAAR
jgi:L-threonylcarbamoyladenylate synthase